MDEKEPLLLEHRSQTLVSDTTGETLPTSYTYGQSHLARSPRRHPLSALARMLLLLALVVSGLALFYNSAYLPSWITDLPVFQQTRHHDKIHITQLKHLDSSLLPSEHKQRRLLIVGDVHGCSDSLKALLDEIEFSKKSDHLILAGDTINKGPDSHGVISLARSLGASSVRGNHEDKCLALRGLQDPGIDPVGEAGSKKLVEAAECSTGLSKKDIDYLSEAPLILSLGRLNSMPHAAEIVVVHAGLVPGVPLKEQDPFAVMHMRAISRSHHRQHKQKDKGKFVPEEGRQDGKPWYKVWNAEQDLLGKKKGMAVVYGHDSKTGLNERKWSVGLDSGCVNGDRLSGLLVTHDKAEVVSVKCKDDV